MLHLLNNLQPKLFTWETAMNGALTSDRSRLDLMVDGLEGLADPHIFFFFLKKKRQVERVGCMYIYLQWRRTVPGYRT